jgi:hypothetical protein
MRRDSASPVRCASFLHRALGQRVVFRRCLRLGFVGGAVVTDAYMMREYFGLLASDSSFFIVMLAFGICCSTLAALKRGGLL